MLKYWLDSLVNRTVVLVVVVIVASALAVTVVNSLVSRSELEAQAQAQLDTIAEVVAGDLDDKLAERFQLLTHVASNFTMSEEVFRSRGQVLANQQAALQALFDAFYLFDEQGEVIGSYPERNGAIGRNVAERSYFRHTLQQMTTLISEPYLAAGQDSPAIMMTAPVFNHRGRLIGVVGGAIRLSSDNFLGDIIGVTIGQTGYIAVASRSGVTLAHGSRQEEVMQPLPESNPALQQARQGYEGTLTVTNSIGVRSLMTVKQMTQAPWFVGAVWPLAEAYAPARRITDVFVWVLLGVIAVLAPLILLVLRRLMAPMRSLAMQIGEQSSGDPGDRVRVSGGQEIRQVAESFNRVMDERDQVLASLAEREAFFRSLTRSAPIGIIQADVLGRIEFANPAFEAISGTATEDLRNNYLLSEIYGEDREVAIRTWRKALHAGKPFQDRFRIRNRHDGRLVWLEVMATTIETPEQVLGLIAVARDISHELEVEAELAEEQQRAESILGLLQEGVLMVDSSGQIRYANRAACSFLGAGMSVEGENFFVMTTITDGERTWTVADFLAGADIENLDAVLGNSAGQSFDIELTMLHLHRDDARERLVFVLRDDSERRRQEQRLTWEASHDSLTGLLNRRAFGASLLKWLGVAGVQSTPSVLMQIDLDHFKPVNDEGGHLLGDDLLRQLGQLLASAVRQSDTVARLGGDEFGIILPACGMERARQLAEQIRAGVEAIRIEKGGRVYGVTTSIGLTELSPRDTSPRETFARADEGCYAAKARGRNTVVVVPADAGPEPGT